MRTRTVLSATILVAALACGGNPPTDAAGAFPVRFTVKNELLAPVMIDVDGAAVLGLAPGAASALTVPSSAQWLTWISAKPMDAGGQPIPDDIAGIRVAAGGINGTLEITNIIHDEPYVAASIQNLTSTARSIAIVQADTVTCVSRLPAMAGTVAGYTQTGYYRLRAATELRAYDNPLQCEGAYVTWSNEVLRNFSPRSGQLFLRVTAAP